MRGGKATLTTPPAKEKRKNFFKKPVNDFDNRIAMSVATSFFFYFLFFSYAYTRDIVIALIDHLDLGDTSRNDSSKIPVQCLVQRFKRSSFTFTMD